MRHVPRTPAHARGATPVWAGPPAVHGTPAASPGSDAIALRGATRDARSRLRAALLRPRPPEGLIVAVAAWCIVSANATFWHALHVAGAAPGVQVAFGVALVALHALLFGLFAFGRALKPVLCVLLVVTAFASFFATHYAVLFDVEMIHNVLRTDPAESRELLSAGLLLHVLLQGVAPAVLVTLVPLRRDTFGRAALRRVVFLLAMALLAAGALGSASQGIFSLVRADHALRYRITPGNVLVSAVRAAGERDEVPPGERRPVATDARQTTTPVMRRPRLLVLVIGETVRADHWGLNGYARDTTPRLRARGVVNFPDVAACGSSTEVSLPCMFSALGRAHYDRDAIRAQQSLLDVVARTGVTVDWLDNQSGCKGVCAGTGMQTMTAAIDPAACRDGRCLDAVLVTALRQRLDTAQGDTLLVLHMLGNHGPAYFERYPETFARYRPVCTSADLARCARPAIVNAYDNAILYTDAVLGQLIDLLAARSDRDSALLYVSDHGESLGEYGLFLHGAPYAIAPAQQLQVPMVLWTAADSARSMGVDLACVRTGARAPHAHDDLFPTVLGFFDIATRAYDRTHDLAGQCRAG
ncbi:phosphoethanolamine--lipid A transferase [Luteimonas sp. 9C]|uniref:phosphoethanolamine transferase n=1 Tax=Luteimonas sp. 9C TaxID=2653148 RepID=UPI00135BC737|nr:phosphoethanolamine--lipid A transferase [Luteimonas sp. 9C]